MADQVPAELWLVESYLNSIDVESGRDDLDSAVRFGHWLSAHGREAAATAIAPADLGLARDLRDGLRHLMRQDHGGLPPAAAGAAVEALQAQVPLRAAFDGADPVLRAGAAGGVVAVLGEVLAAIVVAQARGSWSRLKLCRADDCQVVFYDRSRNSSRCWCDMSSCGNRSKARAYRTRHAAGGADLTGHNL